MLTSANEKAGQSGRQSVKMTKRKKRELVFSPPPGGTTVVHRLDAIDFARATITWRKTHNILQTDRWYDQMVILYKIHSFRIIDVPACNDMLPTSQSELAMPIIAEYSKLVAESSEFHLTLSRA